ncbi:MAG: hypothetical protein LBO66_11335 [Deltaproteobacteria bacterium]|jgi:large subunit ribosomal protein L24|nr:hypothetical protein [Deltaproteobacteria bacterium]
MKPRKNKLHHQNKLRLQTKYKPSGFRKDDVLMIRSGVAVKTKTGKFLEYFSKSQRVSVAGLKMGRTCYRPKTEGETREIREMERPAHVSNVAIVCPHCGLPSRVKRGPVTVELPNGRVKTKYVRICSHCHKHLRP